MKNKKYIVSLVLFVVLSFGVSAGAFAQDSQSEAAQVNAIIGLFQFVEDDDIHLKELVNEYFFSDEADANAVTGDVIGVVGKVDPRRFSLSKHTIYNKLLARMLDLIIEKGSISGDVDKMISICESMLFENRDPLIYPKVVQVYSLAQEDSRRFAKYILTTLRRMTSSLTREQRYNTGSVVAASIPHVTQRISKDILTPEITALSMTIYANTISVSALDAMKALLRTIIRESLG